MEIMRCMVSKKAYEDNEFISLTLILTWMILSQATTKNDINNINLLFLLKCPTEPVSHTIPLLLP